MHDKLDNFTADSLQNFIRTPPARSILDEEMDLNAGKNPGQKSGIPRAKPRTARAERIGQILESVSTRPEQHPASDPGSIPGIPAGGIPGGGQGGGAGYHDAQVRQHMGELVRMMLQEGRKEDLAVILQSHQTFITDVMAMLRQGQ
ncbi:MAG: hypothetical protein RIF32_04745 [Leptospirales bacterium]|jgi:hypothetical protein